jgi:hypothetical protein
MATRNHAAGLAAIAALALLLELAALYVMGPRLVAQVQRSAPQGWISAVQVTGRALTRAAASAGSHALAATARATLAPKTCVDRTIVLAAARSVRGAERCRLETLQFSRSDLRELERVRVRLGSRSRVLVLPGRTLIAPLPTHS